MVFFNIAPTKFILAQKLLIESICANCPVPIGQLIDCPGFLARPVGYKILFLSRLN